MCARVVCEQVGRGGGGRRRGGRRQAGVHNQKQELHTKMWGKRCPELTILWPRKAKLPQEVHPQVPPTGAASTQAIPGSLGGAPARSTGIDRLKPAHRASKGALCATRTAKAKLINPDQPEASKSSQPSQQDTKHRRNTANEKAKIQWRDRRINLATKAISFPTLDDVTCYQAFLARISLRT